MMVSVDTQSLARTFLMTSTYLSLANLAIKSADNNAVNRPDFHQGAGYRIEATLAGPLQAGMFGTDPARSQSVIDLQDVGPGGAKSGAAIPPR